VLARSTGKALVPVDRALVQKVSEEMVGERLQSELFFNALRRII